MDARRLVGRNLRRLRVARGVSQDALAADSEVERTYLSAVERGRKNPTVLVLERIARALDVPLAELFVVPKPGEAVVVPLRAGRRPKR